MPTLDSNGVPIEPIRFGTENDRYETHEQFVRFVIKCGVVELGSEYIEPILQWLQARPEQLAFCLPSIEGITPFCSVLPIGEYIRVECMEITGVERWTGHPTWQKIRFMIPIAELRP